MSSLTTDFNVSPYFDDYDEAKRYYRILFRPSTAVQARELTQSQTIQQKQIERFGNHVFKDGAVVEGCNPATIPNLQYVRVADEFTANADAFISDITSDYLLVGQTSNVRAVAIAVKTGSTLEYPDTNRFYLKYLSTGANNESVFANSETINIYSSDQNKLGTIVANNLVNTIQVIAANATVNATGTGYGMSVSDGIIFHKGFFQIVPQHTIIIRDYDQSVGNYVVGFETEEEIITENNDETILDNALGYSNENAPGAHRLKLTPTIAAYDRESIANNSTFFAVFEFSNVSNDLVLNKTQDPYETMGEIIDRRTFEESGNYVIKPFLTETIPTSNSQTFSYVVSSGKGYVLGTRVEYLASRAVEVDRATTTLEATSQVITSNYGNYVIVDEFSGALNFSDFVVVDLYDAAFDAVTNRHTPSLVGKNKIGEAKIKAVLHNDGDAGKPATSYRLYLTDINMNSGKSFSADVKSIYLDGGFGKFYADAVLNGDGRFVIQESGKNTLVFPFGKKALKTLRSQDGTVNNTEFYFRESSAGTLQTDGTIAISTGSSYTGGTETLGYSTGPLGDVLESEFLVAMTSNVSSANLTGTISIDSSNTTITAFDLDDDFAAGEYIKIFADGSTIDYRRVVSVNSSAMVVDAVPSTTNATADYAKHYPAGYNIPLIDSTYPGTRQVNVTSDTTFEVTIGVPATLESTANVVVQYRMRRSEARAANKDVNKDRFVKLYANASTDNSWNLGLPDVYKIKHVYANNSGFTNNDSDEITNKFVLDNGQRDDYYDHSKLVLKPQYAGSFTDEYFTVVVDHFSANLTNGVGFFSVDSYSIDDANTANTTAITTAEIPLFTASDGVIYDLRDCVDFRGYKANTANSATTLGAATLNPATTDTFINYTTTYIAEPDTNIQSDIEYYLGRIDLVVMNNTGGLNVIQGIPSEDPKTPKADVDVMTIATGFVPPYPSLSVREAEISRRLDYAVRTRISTNRGYTMKDIGVLDQRIQRLEYYTTLNQLEQQAQNIQVPDANGLNRFKNGIFADPMNSHAYGKTNDIEYRWAIDMNLGYGRPTFSTENVDLTFVNASSSGVQLTGRSITRPYTNELYIYQPFATKFRNNAQDLWSWKGSCELYPSYDMNRDETRLPNLDISIDLTQPFLDFAEVVGDATGTTIFGTRYGDWVTTSRSRTRTNLGRRTALITETTNQTQLVTDTFIIPISEEYDLGSYVTDVSVQPYMKARNIAFIARNLKPNTRIYAFFDDTAVSEYCAPAELNTDLGSNLTEIYAAVSITGNQENVVKRTGVWGDPLITDEFGTLYGMFRVPEGTFRTGDRQLQLVDVDDIAQGIDGYLTRAAATFTASSIAITTRNTTITSITPESRQTSFTNTRTTIRTWITEPIAQSLTIESPQEQSGVFITSMDLFFKKKDPNLGIKVVFVDMTNGFPDPSVVYGAARLDSADVEISDDASVASTFTFDNPIFVSANKQYAFYVESEGQSPEYQMWMSETGFTDVTTNAQVYKNPYCGDAFRSSNAKTWTALPKEDIKFNIYVANFQVGTGTAVFTNENDEYITYSGLAVANSSIPVAVGHEVFVVNSTSNTSLVSNTTTAVVQFIDTTNAKMKLDQSTGGFSNGDVIGIFNIPTPGDYTSANSTTLVATATIEEVYDPVLHAVVPRYATMLPLGTNIAIGFKGTSNSAVVESTYHDLSLDFEREMVDFERLVYSRSNEIELGTGKSLTMRTILTNTNKYVSPVIDLARKSALVIENIINNDNTNEDTRYGNAIAKYIGKPVVLADGQEAEDLKIYLSGYRPYNTDIEVYIKFLNNEDPSVIDNKVWTKLENETPSLRSSPVNIYDFKDFVFNVPNTAPVTYGAYKNVDNFGIVEYEDENGVIYQSFKTFAIKIVLLSSSGVFVPKVNDIRGIALQV